MRIENAYRQQEMPSSTNELRSWLTLKNLGHLFGDALLKNRRSKEGQALEGDTIANSLSFLSALLSVLDHSSNDEMEPLTKAREQLKKTIPICVMLNLCLANEQFKHKYLPPLCKIIEAQIEALSPGESLLLPSGWSGMGGKGHAMLVEVLKNRDETLSLFVINTGAGTEMHAHHPSDLKTRINPLRTFQATKQELSETTFILSLLSPKAYLPKDGANDYKQADIYNLLFSRFNESPIPASEERFECAITAQRSGTCTMRAALTYLHALLGSHLYKRLKIGIDYIAFQAMNDPLFMEKASLDPAFIQLLDHSIASTSLHLNKHKDENELGLSAAQEFATLLQQIEKYSIAFSKKGEEIIPPLEVEAVENSFLELAATSLEPIKAVMHHPVEKSDELTPSESLILPPINFSQVTSGEELMSSLDELIHFYDDNSKNPLDPLQVIAINLTTEAISELSLPNNGKYSPTIDDNSLIGSLSIDQKKRLREKIKILAQKYSTALYNGRKAAIQIDCDRWQFWGESRDSHKDPYQDPESVEQYICINKMYALYWRLSLTLENVGEGQHSLNHYGIDTSHLVALKNSIHLPCYSPQISKQLDELIQFFNDSHPDRGNPKRTLLAISNWSTTGSQISLPLSERFKKAPSEDPFAETILFEEYYRIIPEEYWREIDYKRDTLPNSREKPDLKNWRIANLFAYPEIMAQFNPQSHFQTEAIASSSSSSPPESFETLTLYNELREMAFTCLFFKIAPHETPIKFSELKWETGYKAIETSFESKPNRSDLGEKARKAKEPFHVGQSSHPSLSEDVNIALRRNTPQNDYLIQKRKDFQHFYEIAHAEPFILHRLISHFQDNTSDLELKNNQVFLNLILFTEDRLRLADQEDPDIVNEVLHLIEQALSEFKLQQRLNPSKKELIDAFISLNTIKLRIYDNIASKNHQKEKIHLELQNQIDEILNSEIEISPEKKAQLHQLWICALQSSDWSNKKSCTQALVHLAKAEYFTSKSNYTENSVDPSLQAFTYQTIFRHLNDLKMSFSSSETLFKAAQKILSFHNIDIEETSEISGSFPQISLKAHEHLYEFNLLNGEVLRDKISLTHPMRIYNNLFEQHFFKEKRSITKYLVYSNENESKFYINCGGKHYYLTSFKDEQNQWQSQIEWTRDSDTFCYIPYENVPDELKRIALSKTPKEDNYHYWMSTTEPSIAAIIENITTNSEEIILYTNGTAERQSHEGRWKYTRIETIPNFAQLTLLQSKEQIAVWDNCNDPQTREIQCLGLTDREGNPLTFKSSGEAEKLELINYPGYSLSPTQTIRGFNRNFPYLIVENEKGEKKAIVPIKTWSEVIFTPKDKEKNYQVEIIDINEKGDPKSSEIKQNLLLAYYFLGSKQYDKALKLIQSAESARLYTPEELKMLAWIFLHHKETQDHSPKAIALSLTVAHMAQENLRNFPQAYLTSILTNTITHFHEKPQLWVQFWKGCAQWEKTAEQKKGLHNYLGKLLAKYYEVSAHCTGDFQIHNKLLTHFQEAEWLKETITNFPDPSLIHRLNFLISGESDPTEVQATPKDNLIPKLVEKIPELDWIHSLKVDSRDHKKILTSINRIRPEEHFKNEFGKLYSLAKNGSEEEKQQLLVFLKDMQYDPNETNQLIRAILLSQIPPYNIGPLSTQNNTYSNSPKQKSVSEEIAAQIEAIAEKRHYTLSGALRPYFPYSISTHSEQLAKLLLQWHTHFFPDLSEKSPSAPIHTSFDTSSLLPTLSQEKKEKLSLPLLGTEPSTIGLNRSANRYFKPIENPPGNTLLPPLPPKLSQDPYFKMRGDALRNDIEEGMVHNQSKSYFNLIAGDVKQLKDLRKSLKQQHAGMRIKLRKRKKEIREILARVGINHTKQIEAQLLRLGKKVTPPTLNECIALFVQGDLTLYQQKIPFLDELDCIKLHNKIGHYLKQATTDQRLTRTLNELDKVFKRGKKGKNTDIQVHNLALEMHKKREYNPSTHPELMVFEYYSGLSLRKEQCENLIKMTSTDTNGEFPPLLLQMIMSAGKTFVLGTLLALMKADGYHLSLLFTPRSLLDTNATEMKERTKSFFGQRGHTFTFNRGKEFFNISYLRNLHNRLIHAINQREYLILAPETLLSMQNQYIEAREKIYSLRLRQQTGPTLLQNQAIDSEINQWEISAQELKKILHLIRTRAAATFDEIDTQFSPRRELNYPGIETTKLDRTSTELVSAIYEIASTNPDVKAIGLNLHANTQSHLIPQQIAEIRPILTAEILNAIRENPLWCQNLGLGIPCDLEKTNQLASYFLAPEDEAPQWIANLHASPYESDKMAAERLILIRQEILDWLPSCWKYSTDEHFSRSKEHPDYLAAKPNICANTPNENAEIAHLWELVNKTLQLYISNGVDTEQAKVIIESLQKLAVIQHKAMGSDAKIEQTPAALLFYQVAKRKLLEINTNDKNSIRQFQKRLNSGTTESVHLIIQYLNEEVFPKLKFHRDQIHNTTMNLSGACLSEQGYSGTVDNPYIFSQSYLQIPDERISLDKGANGRVIDKLCTYNRTIHSTSPDIRAPEELMNALHRSKSSKERNLFNAFIDIGAYFKGRSNSEIAHSFLHYFTTLDETTIDGILYYDDVTNQLACLKRGNESKPILLSSTDPKTIHAMTGLKPHRLFTFYDQFHTVGSNILQDPDAKAFYTVGDQTVLRDQLQGSMRMRNLLEEQQIEGIIPQELIPLMAYRIEQTIDSCPSIEQVLLFGEINGLLKDREDNLKAFTLKINAVIRKQLFDKFYMSSPEEEEALYTSARSFFIKSTVEELFVQYGGAPTQIDLEVYINRQVVNYFERLQAIKPHFTIDQTNALEEEIRDIATSAQGYLPSEISSRTQHQNTTVEKITDIENKVDKLNDLDLDTQKDLGSTTKPNSARETPWDFDSLETVMQQLVLLPKGSPQSSNAVTCRFAPLSDIMSDTTDHIMFSECFSPNFMVSMNFIQTAQGELNLFDNLQKRSYEALIFKDQENRPYLLILTSKEAKDFYLFIKSQEDPCPFSLLNLTGDCIAGSPLEESDEIEQLRVQMLFFGGRLSTLEKPQWQPALTRYLAKNCNLKKELFEIAILKPNQFREYHNSKLRVQFNSPSEPPSETNMNLRTLKSALFAINRGRFSNSKKVVENQIDNLNEESGEELSLIIDIALLATKNSQSKQLSSWGIKILKKILPEVEISADNKNFKPLEKLLEFLSNPIDQALQHQITQIIIQHIDLPLDIVEKAFINSTRFQIDDKTDTSIIIDSLRNTTSFLSLFKESPKFKELVNNRGHKLCEFLDEQGFKGPSRKLSDCIKENIHILNFNIFTAIVELTAQLSASNPTQADLLLEFVTPYLTSYLPMVLKMRKLKEAPWNQHIQIYIKTLYSNLNEKYYGISDKLDHLIREHLLDPLIKGAHRDNDPTSTEAAWNDSDTFLQILNETKVPYALENAENIKLKFERKPYNFKFL